jgi:hypothetical protein
MKITKQRLKMWNGFNWLRTGSNQMTRFWEDGNRSLSLGVLHPVSGAHK